MHVTKSIASTRSLQKEVNSVSNVFPERVVKPDILHTRIGSLTFTDGVASEDAASHA